MDLKLKNTDNRIRKWKSDALIVWINQIQIEMFKCFDSVLTQRCIEWRTRSLTDREPLLTSYAHEKDDALTFEFFAISTNVTDQGCARFADFCANSWRLDCFSHSITMVAFTLTRCKRAKIQRNEHSPDISANVVHMDWSFNIKLC